MKVFLRPHQALTLLRKLETPTDGMALIPVDTGGMAFVPADTSGIEIVFDAIVDSSPTVHQITLHGDGTWSATTMIEV